jgi:hypothetical protein
MRALGPSLAQVYTVARNVIPIIQLISADRNTIIGSIANFGQATNITTTVGPNGAVAQGAAAGLSFWNEVIGGWVRRLPTNRLNPYAKPNSSLEIATSGLHAFDCRNIHNPLYLPPTRGAPPCLTQGPWTFDGRSAEFPHLYVDPPYQAK